MAKYKEITPNVRRLLLLLEGPIGEARKTLTAKEGPQMTVINWARLGRAVAHYEKLGATYMDVPWWVSPNIDDITRPKDREPYIVSANAKALVASGEQSFLSLAAKGQVPAGLLRQTITPCFRAELQDGLHRKHFMKLEIFMHSSRESCLKTLRDVESAAREFFEAEIGCEVSRVLTTGANFDLVIQTEQGTDIELGSYGVREHETIGTWLYATGCAEPRTSVAIASRGEQSPGYHLAAIPRGVYGELSKVAEELAEAFDAEAQGVNLMLLQELSDLVGAAGAVAERHGSSLDDIVRMANVTARAFQSGHRKKE